MSKNVRDINILVVDDEEKICELIKIFLESAYPFHSIVTANNSVMSSQKCQNQEFDLLILDYVLPGKNGIEYIQQLKSSARFNKMKIILISSYLEQEDVLTLINLGVKNIVVKPFTREQLISHVEDVLKIKRTS